MHRQARVQDVTPAVLLQGLDVSNELTAAFEAISNVLAARGRVRQKRSRPLRARLTLTCPKVGLTDAAAQHCSACMLHRQAATLVQATALSGHALPQRASSIGAWQSSLPCRAGATLCSGAD